MSSASVPKAYSAMSQHWIKTTLARLPDFHILHRRHEHLVPKITAVLQQMQSSGEMDSLKHKFGLQHYNSANAEKNFGVINVVSASWKDYSDTPQGTYFKILDTIYQGHLSRLDVNIVNWKRAKQAFYDGQADILVGAYDFEVTQQAIRSDIHLDYELPVSAFAKNKSKLTAILSGEIQGSACYLLGYDLDTALPDSVTSYEVAKISNCIDLLNAGRVDMLLDYEIDLDAEFVATHAKQEVLEGFPLFMVFHNNRRGWQLRDHFEARYRQLILDGKLVTLFPSKGDYRSANFVPTATQNP